MKLGRVSFALFAGLTVALTVTLTGITPPLAAQEARPASGPPNVLLILADDLGYGDLSSYGAKDLQSPNLDRLAASGLRFDRFYANSSVCSPTRAALLSGRYQEMIGVPGVIRTHATNSWGQLTKAAVLLPQAMRAGGYHTAMVGKWHLGLAPEDGPMQRGFQHFHGWLGDMMDDYYKHRRHGVNYMRLGEEVIDPEGHATDLFQRWAQDYLVTRQDLSEPFFLYLAFNAPHTPIQPPAEWVAKIKAREAGISERRARLVALIEHMDHAIGEVLATLEATGLADNTLVVFTSDNGGQLNVGGKNGKLRGGKQDMYEGGLRVPAIVRWPGRVLPGGRSDRELLTMDIFTTIIEAAGLTPAAELDGVSFLDTLLGETPRPQPRLLHFGRREGGLRYGGQTTFALRDGDWKLLQNSPWEPLELYHLGRDPLETDDLREKMPREYRRLLSLRMQATQRFGSVPWQRTERVESTR